MPSSPRKRILTVYRGETPEAVPFMLDLSHWFYHRTGAPWDLSRSYEAPERELLDYHKSKGIGFYVPNLGAFFTVEYPADVAAGVTRETHCGRDEIVWRYTTPLGSIERRRIWNPETYAWALSKWGVESEQDLRVLACALGSRTYVARWDRYRAWTDYVGDCGVVYLPLGYSAVGELLHYWMGVEAFAYAACDRPDTVHEVIERINANNLARIDVACSSPAEIVILGDNFSSDVQPPRFFDQWSRAYYEEAVRRLHDAGKRVAVHIDGRLRGALAMIRDTCADCADAVTPAPMGDLTPEECRAEAGPDFILSGGLSPDLWLPSTDIGDFERAVLRWLDLRHTSPRLIAAAGDQVPPGADERRIELMRDLVERHGRY